MKDSKILAEQGLRDIYYDPSAGYQSAKRLYQKAYQKAKVKGLSVSRRVVRDWLKTQDTYTRYKPITRKHKYRKTYVKTLRTRCNWTWWTWGSTGTRTEGTAGY